jgi:hypothetical protein
MPRHGPEEHSFETRGGIYQLAAPVYSLMDSVKLEKCLEEVVTKFSEKSQGTLSPAAAILAILLIFENYG